MRLLGAVNSILLPVCQNSKVEEIFVGTVREVKEENGIDTKFVEVIGFRNGGVLAHEWGCKWNGSG